VTIIQDDRVSANLWECGSVGVWECGCE
jgi:hypothetical protein